MKLLITGGFGYLGGRLAQFLATDGGYEIRLGSRQYVAPPRWLPQAKVAQTQWDVPAVLGENCTGVDAVVHLAGMNAQDCAADSIAALEFNAVATARLLQAAIQQGVRRFVYLSTAHVYSSPLTGVITEKTCPVSLHPYATSHRAGEDVVRAAHQRGEIEGVVIRLSNAFGAPAHKDVNCWMLSVNDLCRQAVTSQRIMLRSSGMQRRDFIAVTDACRAIRHLLELPADKLGDGLFNVGGRWAPTVMQMTQRVAERICSITGDRPEILRKEDQSAENREPLDYGMAKLISTGFASGGSSNVDREIDALIKYCLNQFS